MSEKGQKTLPDDHDCHRFTWERFGVDAGLMFVGVVLGFLIGVFAGISLIGQIREPSVHTITGVEFGRSAPCALVGTTLECGK